MRSDHALPGARFGPAARRARLLATHRIDLVIDVGANSGQYASDLRAAGYRGRIVSFEPLAEPYARLAAASAADACWAARRVALGAHAGTLRAHVAEDTRNSSLFAVGERHLRAVPDSRLVRLEEVEVQRLDAIWSGIACEVDRVHLKVDTQGYELEVLRGSAGVLSAISLVEVELSLVPVYEGAPLFGEVFGFLDAGGFAATAFECVLDDEQTGEMLQVDGIFRRASDAIDAGGR